MNPATFTVDGVTCTTVHNWMMAEWTRRFDDAEMLAQIIESGGPPEAKALGPKVRSFDADTWSASCCEIVVNGGLLVTTES